MTGSIIALDFGAELGWARRFPAGSITSGTLHLPTGSKHGYGARFLHFRRWLTEQHQAPVERIFYEQVNRHVSTDSAHSYGGFLAIMAAWCEVAGVLYVPVEVGTWRAFVVGNGNASKAQTMAAIKARGFNPGDDNEADALAILEYVTRAPGAKPAPRIKSDRPKRGERGQSQSRKPKAPDLLGDRFPDDMPF